MCAFVCHAWVPSSHYHLFGEVNIWACKYDQVSDLIRHLNHPLCTFAPSVRELLISTSPDGDHLTFLDLLHDALDLPLSWADPLIPYLPKLISITTLYAHKIESRLYGWKPLFKSVPFVTQITHLSLDSAEFMTFEDFMYTIHSFPSLESLKYFPPSFPHSHYDQGTLPSLPAFSGSQLAQLSPHLMFLKRKYA